MVLWWVSCPLLWSATTPRPPPLHFVHVHVCLLCYCVQHAQITVCMVHVYDLCSVRYLLDRSSSHARRHCTPVGMGVISAAASLPRYIVYSVHFNHLVCVPSFFALLSSLSFSPVPPSLTFSLPPSPSLPPSSPLPPSLPLSCPPVVMYMYTSREISGKITHTIYPPCTDLLESWMFGAVCSTSREENCRRRV